MRANMIEISNKGAMRGGIFLFVALLMPILILGIILITEIPILSFNSNSHQATLDTLVLSAAQQLPDDKAARLAFEANSPFSADSTSLVVTPESIEATATSKQTPLLLSYFGVDKEISTTVRAKAIIPPLSVTIALDTNSYTAPTGTKEWATNSPAAALFSLDKTTGYKSQLSSIRQTQGCFNELSLPMKRIAIETYRSLSRVPRYRVSAAVMPTSIDSLNSSYVGVTAVKTFKKTPLSSADWVEYRGLHHSNSRCASAALHETLFVTDSPYRFPPRALGTTPGVGPNGELIVDLEHGTFNSSYAPYLTVEEVFWSQAANENQRISSIESLFSLGAFAIAEDRAIEKIVSSSLQNTNTVVAIVVAGDLPRSLNGRFPDAAAKKDLAGAITKLEELALDAKVNLHIPYILFKNRTGVTIEEGAEFSTFLNSLINSSNIKHVRITPLMTESGEKLEQTLLPFLKNLRQPVVLSR
jgi:hypothetical protein